MSKNYLSTVMSYALYKKDMLDDRRLVPIDEARKILSGFESFEAGELMQIGDEYCTGSDRTFAALCSLENPEEFLNIIKDKRWNHATRMDLICALAQRYGEKIIPWLESMVDETSNFPDKGFSNNPSGWPPCLHDCLFMLSSDEAAELAFKIERPQSNAKSPYFLSWLERNSGKESWFIEKVKSGDERARSFYDLREKQFSKIPEVKKILAQAEKIKAKKGPSLSYTTLQEHFDRNAYPSWIPYGQFCGAMIISGFVDPVKGDCLIIQSLVHNNSYIGIHRELWKIGGDTAPYFAPINNVQIVPIEILYNEDGEPISDEKINIPYIGAQVQVAVNAKGLTDEQSALFDFDEIESTIAVRLGQDHKDKVFLQDHALKAASGISDDAIELFRFNAHKLPAIDESVTDSLDFITMMEALKKRKAIKTLPSNIGELDSLIEALELY